MKTRIIWLDKHKPIFIKVWEENMKIKSIYGSEFIWTEDPFTLIMN